MKKWVLIFILLLPLLLRAADTKVENMTIIYDPQNTDRLYVVDDPNGTPAARAITLIGLFNIMDTSAELLAIIGDETGTGALVFGTSPTFTTSIVCPLVTHGSATKIGDNTPTVEIDSSDWDISTAGVMTGIGNITSDGTIEGAILTESSNAVPNVTDNLSVFAATTSAQLYGVLSDETGSGAGAPLAVFNQAPTIDSPTFTTAITATDLIDSAHYAADSIDNEHINWADLTYLDDNGAVDIAAYDAVGTFESGDTFLVLEAGVGIREADYDDLPAGGGATAWDDIGNPDNSGTKTITFDNAEKSVFTGDNDEAGSFFTLQNSDADHTVGQLFLLDLYYSADDGDAEADFIRFRDSGGDVMTIQQNGAIATDGGITSGGTIEGATLTESGNAVPNATDNLSFFSSTTSAQLHGVLSNETGSGAGSPLAVFNQNPTIDSPYFTTVVNVGADDVPVGLNIHDGASLTLYDDSDEQSVTLTVSNDTTTLGVSGSIDAGGDLQGTTVTGTAAIVSGNFDAIGAVDMDYGSGDITDHTFTTDGTGTAEIVLPAGSIDGTEILDDTVDSADYAADSIDNEHINWADIDNLGDEGALTVTDTIYAGCYPAMFEAATGDLAIHTDGGITYDASTANLSTTTFTGALSGNATTCTTASAGDAAVDFFGAGVDAVTDTTTCTDIEGTGLSIAAGTLNWSAASTDLTDTADLLYETELDDFSELQAQIADKTLVNTADGAAWTGDHDFGGADLEIPQGQTPDNDGDIDADFTDGSLVIQHGSAHGELSSATDVVIGKLIHSFAATLAFPDTLQGEIDNWPLKAIETSEFPHGIVVTDIYLKTSASSSYALNVENWDDPTTINGANGTIDAIATSTSTEANEDTITFDTIPDGQIIMLDLDTDDIGWIYVQVEYYEPISG